MLIQAILILFVVFALVKIFSRYQAGELTPLPFVFWIIFWLTVLLIVWQPDLSTQLANSLGVGRGTDLVTYFSLAALFYLIFRLTVRLERIDKNITKIVRHLALGRETSLRGAPHQTQIVDAGQAPRLGNPDKDEIASLRSQ